MDDLSKKRKKLEEQMKEVDAAVAKLEKEEKIEELQKKLVEQKKITNKAKDELVKQNTIYEQMKIELDDALKLL